MPKKLRLRAFSDKEERIVNIEEFKDWDYFDPHALVFVENQLVHNYNELIELASSDDYKHKEILDVYFMITITGG
jgi:hypothetical protein